MARRREWLLVVALIGLIPLTTVAEEAPAVRPVVPGKIATQQRLRVETAKDSNEWQIETRAVEWEAAATAIIVCDMWDDHYCKLAAARVREMVPRLNRVLTHARNHGVMVIHAPSGVLNFYADTPYRKRMALTPRVEPPFKLETYWCDIDTSREPKLPIDTSRSPCDDPIVGSMVQVFHRQHPGIEIIGYDGISDRSEEIFSFCQKHGLKNIIMTGVHTNMCVLGRPFGIRQLVKLGFNVVLARDMTDAMYDPREYPYVSHARGTELVVEHIEKYWCPSIHSEDLVQVIPGTTGPVSRE